MGGASRSRPGVVLPCCCESLAGARLAYGTKIPDRMKSLLGAVLATPSGPPSRTTIWPSSVLSRLPATDAPGTTALKLVLVWQVEPTGVLTKAHASGNRNCRSSTVAEVVPDPLL